MKDYLSPSFIHLRLEAWINILWNWFNLNCKVGDIIYSKEYKDYGKINDILPPWTHAIQTSIGNGGRRFIIYFPNKQGGFYYYPRGCRKVSERG